MAATDEVTNGEHETKKNKLHFVIVGGSLGGLAAGITLKALGHDTTVLERNPAPLLHDQGAGIVVGGPALQLLEQHNRCRRRKRREDIAVRAGARQYLDRAGNVVHTVENANHYMSSWDLTYHLLRANYDGLTNSYCDVPNPDPSHGTAVHLHDHTVTGIAENREGVLVSWQRTSEPSVTGTLWADRVVGAEGPSSLVRSLSTPTGVERTYAGYCALRGTVAEREVNAAAWEIFTDRFTFYHAPCVQILAYLTPGANGTVKPGERLINFAYYANLPNGSAELEELLTDRHGRRHRITVPPGLTDPGAWARQCDTARERLPPQFAELVCKAQRPFVQAVTDVISPTNEFLNGRVVLIGDALAGFRPHTVASPSQATFDAMLYADYVAGRVGQDEWKRKTLGYARFVHKRGVDMGQRSQHQQLALEEYIRDRDEASIPIRDDMFP